MQDITLCPFCAEEIQAVGISCKHCGRYLHSMRLARSQARSRSDLYEIIPEGEQFAIAFRGDVKVHGLGLADLAKAQRVLAILNSVIDEVEEAG
jgi:hypothetical protein